MEEEEAMHVIMDGKIKLTLLVLDSGDRRKEPIFRLVEERNPHRTLWWFGDKDRVKEYGEAVALGFEMGYRARQEEAHGPDSSSS